MQFSFQTRIKESVGAVNTCARISKILAESEVVFSTLASKKGVPGIWVKLPGEDKPKLLAHMEDGCPDNNFFFRHKDGDWWVPYPANPFTGHDHECYVFEHLTDAAYEMVGNWITELCTEYSARLERDLQPA